MLAIFQKARQNKYAIGAFNASNLEQIRAIVQAGQKLASPLMIATSEGESNFIGLRQAVALVKSWRQQVEIPIILHLDHGKSFERIKEAVEVGYDSVHFDGSELSFEENIEMTKKVVDYVGGLASHIIVEGELGYLPGKSALHGTIEIKKEDLTDPDQALEFVEKTGVDSLAVAIGNIHGIIERQKAGQFGREGSEKRENPHLFLERLKEIRDKIGDKAFLVLHGGSGTPEDDIKKAIDLGIVKVNINTELRLAYSQALKKSLQENPQETTPYKIMPPVVEAVQKVVETKLILFGSDSKI